MFSSVRFIQYIKMLQLIQLNNTRTIMFMAFVIWICRYSYSCWCHWLSFILLLLFLHCMSKDKSLKDWLSMETPWMDNGMIHWTCNTQSELWAQTLISYLKKKKKSFSIIKDDMWLKLAIQKFNLTNRDNKQHRKRLRNNKSKSDDSSCSFKSDYVPDYFLAGCRDVLLVITVMCICCTS